MDYRAIERSRAVSLFMGAAGVLVVLCGLLFWAWTTPVSYLEEPDYERVFFRKMAEDFHRLTGGELAVVVTDDNRELNFTFSGEPLPMFIIAPDQSYMPQSKYRDIDSVWFNQYPGENKAYLGFFDRDVAAPLAGMTNYKDLSTLRPLITFGQVSPGQQLAAFNVFLNFSRLHLERLHWKSNADPDFKWFYENIVLQLIRLWNPQATINFEELAAELRWQIVYRYRYEFWLTRVVPLLGLVLMFVASRRLRRSHQVCCADPVLTLNMALAEKEYGVRAQFPKYWEFLEARDLEKFAWSHVQQLRSLRQNLEQQVREQRRLVRGREAEEAVERDKGQKRELQRQIEKLLWHWDALCSSTADPEAQECYLKAIAETNLVRKMRWLQQAVDIQEAAIQQKEEAAAGDAELSDEYVPRNTDPVYETMDGEIDAVFPKPDFLPERIDPVMVKVIVVVLLQPGYRESRIERNSLSTTLLEEDVEKYFARRKLQFDRRIYRTVFGWLENNGVLKYSGKTTLNHEGSYSLCGKPGTLPPGPARLLVYGYLKFHREFQRAHM